MSNIKRHKECPFRTKLANCDAVGGFCTSVNETICEGIHKALNMNPRGKTGVWETKKVKRMCPRDAWYPGVFAIEDSWDEEEGSYLVEEKG